MHLAGPLEVEASPVVMSRCYLFYSCTAETKQDVWPRIWNPCTKQKADMWQKWLEARRYGRHYTEIFNGRVLLGQFIVIRADKLLVAYDLLLTYIFVIMTL